MIWALHGFLGRGDDWRPLGDQLARQGMGPLRAPHLFGNPAPPTSLTAWAARFTREVAATDPAPILLGYSLGGRLALHALLAQPALWRAAVIVSAHPGLVDRNVRAVRIAEDARWAERFERERWETLLAAWDARPVFGGATETRTRPESAFERSTLATALREWSLGTQDDLRPRLAQVSCDVLWIAGARDERYVALAEEACGLLPNATLAVAPDTGHRVPWEKPDWFAERVIAFLRDIDNEDR